MRWSFVHLSSFVSSPSSKLSVHIIYIYYWRLPIIYYIRIMKKISTQVIISGCGPVGLSLANCLVKSPLVESIIILDRKLPSQSRQLPPLANQRVFSINGPSLRLLKNLKVLPIIRQRGIMEKVQVVSKQSLSFVNWSDNEANIIQNDELIYGLMNELKNSAYSNKVTYIQDEVQQIQKNAGSLSVKLKNNSTNNELQTKLLVGSDGINSNVKKLAGISHYGWNYRQKGIVCTLKVDGMSQNKTAYQIYHDRNVLALLPLWDNYLSLVWSVGLPDFQYLTQLSDQQFAHKINNVIKNSNYHMKNKANYMEIPDISEIVNKRLSFPLSTLQSSSYTQQRIALVGDAAHTIHPMAGLGVNSGIMDSILLANNLIKNIKSGNDIGDLIALSQYEAKAKAFNYANSLAMQTIKKTFENDSWISNKLRQLGMGVAQSSGIIKEAMKNVVDDQSLRYEWQLV